MRPENSGRWVLNRQDMFTNVLPLFHFASGLAHLLHLIFGHRMALDFSKVHKTRHKSTKQIKINAYM